MTARLQVEQHLANAGDGMARKDVCAMEGLSPFELQSGHWDLSINFMSHAKTDRLVTLP